MLMQLETNCLPLPCESRIGKYAARADATATPSILSLRVLEKQMVRNHFVMMKKHKFKSDSVGTNSANGSQPLSPKIALIFWEKFSPFSNFPLTKHVAQYSDWAAPILNPPIPSFTVKIYFVLNINSTGIT